jgi:hypothetical protein
LDSRLIDAAVEAPGRRAWPRGTILDSVAPALFTSLAVVCTAAYQGGYFATSWGWSAIALLGVLVTWTMASGLTDAGRFDIGFILALVLLTGWVGFSIAWSADPAQSVLELERALVPLAGCAAFLALARRRALRSLTLALVIAIMSIGTYSLATRLVPDRMGFYDSTTGYRLSDPVGYWNSLGIFVVMGILLALGLATERGAGLGTRAVGATSLLVLPVVLFFTFSRGSWIALAVGFAITVAAARDRVRFVAETAILAVIPAAAVLLASRSTALTDQNALLSAASRQGHRLGVILIALALLAALSGLALTRLETHVTLGRRWHRACGATLLAALVCVVLVAAIRLGGPIQLVKRGYESFNAPTAPEKTNLNDRLFSINGNGRPQLWRVAISAANGHWVGGTGAGSFERSWKRNPGATATVRDAHGLYVETLSELGVVGVVLLVVMLGLPLAAGLAMRTVTLVPAIIGSYAAFLLHNGVDWDWELSAVALTGLLVGSLLLVARREGAVRRIAVSTRSVAVLGMLAAAAFALVGAIGNGALARAETANQQHRYASAEANARLAHRWMPWSPKPLLALGESQLQRGDPAAATASLRQAISIDGRDWQAWLDLAASAQGPTRARAIARARSLYPRSPEIVEFLDELSQLKRSSG